METLRPASCFVPGGDARKSARSRARVGRRRRGPGRPRALGPGDAGARRRRPESPPPAGARPGSGDHRAVDNCWSKSSHLFVLPTARARTHGDWPCRALRPRCPDGVGGGPGAGRPPPGRGDHAHPGRHGAHPDSSPPPAGPPGRSGEGQGHQGLSRRYGTACSFACETTYETHIKIKNCKAI